MSDESNAYAVVIEDLKRQRDEIDEIIVRLEARASGSPVTTESTSASEDDKGHGQQAKISQGEIKEGEFLGKTVIEAARIVLERHRRPMRPAEIMEELELGGLLLTNQNTVASVIHRQSRANKDFVSPKRGVWGLKEWYRGRNFSKSDESDKEDSTEPTEPEQPSERPQIVPLRSDG